MATSSSALQMETKPVPWWLVLLQGIAAIILGFFLLTTPIQTMYVMVVFLGIYWMIDGVFRLVSMFMDHTGWGWKLAGGILGIVAGLIIVQHPYWATVLVPTTLVILVAILGIVMGVIAVVMAFKGGGWGSGILGALSVLFGLMLLFNPVIGAASLPFVLGFFALFGGVASIVMAFKLR